MLDERENAEGAEITRFHNLFRLHDDGDLKLAEFSESSRDAILEQAHPRLIEARTTPPVTAFGATTAEGKAIFRKAVQRNGRASQAHPFCLSPQRRRPEHSRRSWVPLRCTRIELSKR